VWLPAANFALLSRATHVLDRRDAKGVIGSVRQSEVEWSRVECRRRKVVAWGGGACAVLQGTGEVK